MKLNKSQLEKNTRRAIPKHIIIVKLVKDRGKTKENFDISKRKKNISQMETKITINI